VAHPCRLAARSSAPSPDCERTNGYHRHRDQDAADCPCDRPGNAERGDKPDNRRCATRGARHHGGTDQTRSLLGTHCDAPNVSSMIPDIRMPVVAVVVISGTVSLQVDFKVKHVLSGPAVIEAW
jgi:hypothetical protein